MRATGVGARRARTGVVCACLAADRGESSSLSRLLAPWPPRQRVPGIDVSMWQGDVDWAGGRIDADAVRDHASDARDTTTSIRGTRSIWPKASASGLVVGAYHRAKVGLAAGDARAEADHFVDVARNEPVTCCRSWTSRSTAASPSRS